MANTNTAMINFRLNLSKREDKEIYDYIQQFDSQEFKAMLRVERVTLSKRFYCPIYVE